MRRRCGFLTGLVLNYDFTFLALLLAPKEGLRVETCRHCPAHPFRCTSMCASSAGLELVADESVILAYHQLCDTVRDEGFWSGLGARLLRAMLHGGYKKAARRQPKFEHTVRRQLDRLWQLEQAHSPSLDAPADAFALLLQAAAPQTGDSACDRAMAQLLYHLGRWIYLVDARDDLERDRALGSYNPILLRYQEADDVDDCLQTTLDRSLDLMRSSAALLDFGRQEEIVNNVLWLGLPAVCQAVFLGQWERLKKHRMWRKQYE